MTDRPRLSGVPGARLRSRVQRAVASVREDVDAAVVRDPAAASRADLVINSPGLHAIWSHRLAHKLWLRPHLKPVARGLSTGEIALELRVSHYTVQDHLKAIFEKLGVSTRGALVARLFIEHYAV